VIAKDRGYLWDIILAELEDAVGRENIIVSGDELQTYGSDHYWIPRMWRAQGHSLALPDVAVRPSSAKEISRVMMIANAYRIPVVPRGGGSGSQGGALPIYGGILVDLTRMNAILDIDEVDLTVTAQAGINGKFLEDKINKRGLSLPHYPASIDVATLGGYLAARGSGVLSTKYGKAEDLVLSIEVVLPTGDVVRTPSVPSHASGPDLMSLFVGSEGTLGIITQATMRLEPVPDVRSGLEAGRKIMTRRLGPSVMRLHDEASSGRLLPQVLGVRAEGAIMILGVEGFSDIVETLLARILNVCNEQGGRDLGPDPAAAWWEKRYDFFKPPHVWDVPKLFGTTDTVCTFTNMEKLYYARKRLIEEEFGEWHARYFAHFSHWYPWGVMVYDRFLIDSPPQDVHEAIRLHEHIWNRAARVALSHGGVLNEHHGIGLKLGRLMREQYGPGFKVLEGIKQVIDPNGLMNPGKLGFSVGKLGR
jgi:alkyldihydroxyacetonephosphate synthase